MRAPLRVALFVEGSADVAVRSRQSWIDQILNEHLAPAVGCRRFELVVPISKKDVVALDPSVQRGTGSEPLDMKLARLGAGTRFDAAIIAWDLQPEWNGLGTFCRWEETKRLHTLIAESRVLPDSWRSFAAARRDDYLARAEPSQRLQVPQLVPAGALHGP